jgi:hypothetical protein
MENKARAHLMATLQLQCSVESDVPFVHLHFVHGSDATLMCLVWNSVVLDHPAMGQLVKEWVQEAAWMERQAPQTIKQSRNHSLTSLVYRQIK